MDVGIGLPNAVRGVDRPGIVDWARRAEAAGFSSLGTIDRVAFPNYESLISLAAAAAVTERIRLVTDILLAPLRNATLLAKQAATLDHLSGGRLVLGLAPGGREDDYTEAGVDFRTRGRALDAQLPRMRAVWDGETTVGPPPGRPGGPVLLIGGSSDAAIRRTAEFADGWTMGGGTPEMFAGALEKLRPAWREAGRDGEPQTMALAYYALGDDAEQIAQRGLGDYYAWLGDYASMVVEGAAKDAATVRGYRDAFAQAGCGELIFFPASPDPAQVDLLADALADRG